MPEYPPGYGPGGYPQPGYAPPPSTFGYTMGAMGYGGLPQYARQQAVQGGGMAAGSSALGFATNTLPAAVGAGVLAGGVAGNFMELSSRPMMRAAGRFLNIADPTSLVMSAGMSGVGAGWGLGTSAAGAMSFGAIGTGAMGAMGAVGLGTAIAAPYAGLAYGGYKAAEFATNNMWKGGQNYLAGQALANQIGGSVAPGQSMQGQGFAMGNMLRDISSSSGLGTDDVARIAKEMDAQKLFQTTRDMKEFREKFTTAMKAVKEIAQVTKSSIDDAVKMFGDLRAQGFYNTADVQSQAALTQARGVTSGLGYDTMNAVGAAGSGMARQRGLRGRFGSDLAGRNVSAVSGALRAGALNEEEIMEMGGVEAVGLRQSEQQMSFLSSPRGRAMIAAMMGSGGKPDPEKMRKMLGGNMTLETLVTSAAESGLGTLRQAGSRESKEAMMPYAGAAMIQMAMMQQQQMYGGVSKSGTIGMLGTMGLGRQEAEALLATTAQLPKQMRAEALEQQNQQNRLAYDEMSKQQSISGRTKEWSGGTARMFQQMGANLVGDVQGRYTRGMEALFGGREYTGGDERLVRDALRSGGGKLERSGYAAETSIFGNSVNGQLRENYYGSTSSRAQMEEKYGGKEGLEKALKSGELISLGKSGLLGSERLITKQGLKDAESARKSGQGAVGFDDATQSRLDLMMSNKDTYNELMEARKRNLGAGIATAGWIFGGISAISGGAFGQESYQQYQDLTRLSDTFEMARKAGIIEGSWEDMLSGKLVTDKRTGKKIDRAGLEQLAGQFGTQAQRAGGELASRGLFKGGTGGGVARDLQEARGMRDAAINDFTEKFGTVGWFGKTSGAVGLGDTLKKKGTVRMKFLEFAKNLTALNPGSGKAEVDLLLKKKKELIAELGPDSPEAREVEEMFSQASRSGIARRNILEGATGLEKAFQSGAVAEALAAESKHSEQILDDLRSGKMEATDPIKKEVTRIANATASGDMAERQAAVANLMSEVMKEGGVDAKERAVLERLGLGGGGGSYLQALDVAMGKGKGSQKAKDLEKLLGDGTSFTEEETKILGSGSDEEKLKLLSSKGITLDAFKGSTAGETSMEGTELQYKEANLQFINMVSKLVADLSAKGIIADPKADSASDEGTAAGGGSFASAFSFWG